MSDKNKYIINLTHLFEKGLLKRVVGRKKEIERISQVLMRLTKNNPMLIGAIGIGKTSTVEGFATILAQDSVPEMLKGKAVVQVDTATMLMESSSQAEYEDRLRKAFTTIEESNGKLVLLVKDATFFSRANEANKDIAKYLKPKMIDGKIKCIIATDINNFKLHIEGDNDLMRVVQPIYIEEPTLAETIEILIGTKNNYEKYFDIKIPNEAIKMAVELSQRFIKQRLFPEKAIDLLDEASSLLKVDIASGARKPEENTMTPDYITRIISFWTGVPLEKIGAADKERLLNMESFLEKRVIGQPEAVKVIAGAVRRSKSGIQDPNRPLGTFLFIGTTGVGKTELAKALAEFVFDDESALLRLDMSEYMERDSIKRLLGPPPGSSGYENGGVLTEAVRLRPYQVVLFDELEKANSEILNLLLQLLDEGRLTDSKGLTVDFRNTIVIMTSNIGANLPKYQRMEHLKKAMKPEFLARIDDIVPFHGLQPAKLIYIVEIHLNKLIKRAKAKEINLNITLEAKKWLSEEVYVAKNGVRELKRLLQHNVENPIAELIMQDKVLPGYTVTVDMVGNKIKIIKIEGEDNSEKELVEAAEAEAEAEEAGIENVEVEAETEFYEEQGEGEEWEYEEVEEEVEVEVEFEDAEAETETETETETEAVEVEEVDIDADEKDLIETKADIVKTESKAESKAENTENKKTMEAEEITPAVKTSEQIKVPEKPKEAEVIKTAAVNVPIKPEVKPEVEKGVTPAIKVPPKPPVITAAKSPTKPATATPAATATPPMPATATNAKAAVASVSTSTLPQVKVPPKPTVIVKRVVKVVKPPEKIPPKPAESS